jgi:hypothetical protein
MWYDILYYTIAWWCTQDTFYPIEDDDEDEIDMMLKELIDNDVGRYMIEEGDDDDEEDKVME